MNEHGLSRRPMSGHACYEQEKCSEQLVSRGLFHIGLLKKEIGQHDVKLSR